MRTPAEAPRGEFVLYEASDGEVRVSVRFDRETVWLTQEQMGQLFGRERSVITKHVGNVFREGELDPESNVQNLHIAGSDKPVRFYNPDVIISVGYRVKSSQGRRFRQWATRVSHMLRGTPLGGCTANEDLRCGKYRTVIGVLQRTPTKAV